LRTFAGASILRVMQERSYILVHWRHSLPHEPVELWSELDDRRLEVRKVEVWADGRVGFADQNREHGATRLGTAPVPSLSEIAADPQFEPLEIAKAEFERRWASSTRLAAMEPLWVAHPEIPFMSIGWRMGPGEQYMREFGQWFLRLTPEERDMYEKLHPEPEKWSGFWRRWRAQVENLPSRT
jgi:hypothetical protein